MNFVLWRGVSGMPKVNLSEQEDQTSGKRVIGNLHFRQRFLIFLANVTFVNVTPHLTQMTQQCFG